MMGGPGGPPMMGGPGGPPMMGGPPSMGGRGGFDPSSFIDRLDRNGNGMLDPDEMEGPAQFMISRLQRDDPSIRTDRPIPMAKLKEAFDRSRGGGGPPGSDPRGDSRSDNSEQVNAALTVAPLVPGFGGSAPVLSPLLGFGPSAELMSVEVTPADLKEAEERMGRYDRNRDGFLSGDELSSRWGGNPMDFDRNGDGKLSTSELAVRSARMRVAQADITAAESRRRDSGRRRERETKPVEIPDLYNGRKSFAMTKRTLPEGLPGWFQTLDVNGDQQVSMAEYSTDWTSARVEEFQKFDMNADGMITPQECLAAIRGGASASVSSAPASAAVASSSRGPSPMASPSGRGGPAAPPAAMAAPSGPPDAKMLAAAEKIMKRNDKNQDGVLTPDEWKEMLIDPSAADFDRDGRITPTEYAQWLQARSAR
jgi:Ca2+-binding EF-hand superfamily protein